MVQFVPFFSRSKNEDVRVLSNFSVLEVGVHDQIYKSGEHAFQCEKYKCALSVSNDENRNMKLHNHIKKIINAESPLDAKRLGSKSRGMALHENECKKWSQTSIDIQKKICIDKISRHQSVRNILDMYKNNESVVFIHQENRGKSPYWGGRINKKTGEIIGKNILGNIWNDLKPN